MCGEGRVKMWVPVADDLQWDSVVGEYVRGI